jgi:hypothetical protein
MALLHAVARGGPTLPDDLPSNFAAGKFFSVDVDIPFPGHQVGCLLYCKMSNASLELASYIKHRIRVLSLCSWSMKMCACGMNG